MMKIVSFGQQIMLDAEMTVINQITVELSNGDQVSVPASEETVQTLMKLHAGLPIDRVVQPAPVPESVEVDPAAAQYLASLDAEEEDDYDPGEVGTPSQDAVMGTLGEVPVPPSANPPRAIGQPQPQTRPAPRVDADGFALPPKARTVPTDSMGYPIVPQRSRPQQRQLVSDEDGEQI
jgi:hypothetical protein